MEEIMMNQYGVISKVDGVPVLELRQKKSRRKQEINISGILKIEENFTYSKRYALVQLVSGKRAFINELGEKLIECDKIESLAEQGFKGYLVANHSREFKEYLWGYVDEELNEVIKMRYAVQRKLQWGYCFYSILDDSRNTIYILQKDGKVEKVR